MLAPRERALLLQSLHPPAGYRLDRAIGTSYTLDLLALLTVPLAFTFHNWEQDDGRTTRDPVALLHALRASAARVHLFCQAGAIKVPAAGQPLFAYLEPCVIEARPPSRQGIFHPKVWVLRFTADDEPVRYRVVVASRNLTFDRSWDTILTLDGELKDRKNAFQRNHPLGDFVAALPVLAVRPLNGEIREDIQAIADEVRRVAFELPDGFTDLWFHPIGVPGYEGHWPFAEGGLTCLVMSPFMTNGFLDKLAASCEDGRHPLKLRFHIISRAETLNALRPETLERWPSRWVLSDGAEPEEGTEDAEDEAEEDTKQESESLSLDAAGHASSSFSDMHAAESALVGLHAKLFILQREQRAFVFTGSANATDAAFSGNVEFLVELQGGIWKSGADALLGTGEGSDANLRTLLTPWNPTDTPEDPDQELRDQLRRKVETVTLALGAADLSFHVLPSEQEGMFDLELRGVVPDLPPGVTLRCWPASRPPARAIELTRERETGPTDEPNPTRVLAGFLVLAPVELTAFCAFEVAAVDSGAEERARIARHLPLIGAPEDRDERVLRAILKDKETVLRLLWLLLASDELTADDIGAFATGTGRFGKGSALGGLPLLEVMMQALARDTSCLDAAASLIHDLSQTEESRALLPDELDSIWKPILAARKELGR